MTDGKARRRATKLSAETKWEIFLQVAAGEITQADAARKWQVEAQLGRQVPGDKLTKTQVRALISTLRDIVEVLADADPADKAELYNELGVSLEYHPDGTVAVKTQPRRVKVRVGGGT